MKIYRQGDVLLKPVSKIPKSQRCAVKNGRFVLADGEATGHAHTICELDCTLFIDDQQRLFMRTDDGCTLMHQEHGPISVDPGKYEVVRQREYAPGEIRNVAD
jgi:hypothetical protein